MRVCDFGSQLMFKPFVFDGLVVWVLWHMNDCWLFNTVSIFIQVSSSTLQSLVKHKYTVQLSKTFLFKAIQFSQTVLIQTI